MDGKTLLHKLIQQYFVIYTCSMMGVLVYSRLFYPGIAFSTGELMGFMAQALLADLPLLVFYSRRELTQRQWLARYVLHFVLLEAVLVGIGTFNGWFQSARHVVGLLGIVAAVYVMVRFWCYVLDLKTASEINERLQERRRSDQKGCS